MGAEGIVVLVAVVFNIGGLAGVFYRLGKIEAHFATVEKRLDKLELVHVGKISSATA